MEDSAAIQSKDKNSATTTNDVLDCDSEKDAFDLKSCSDSLANESSSIHVKEKASDEFSDAENEEEDYDEDRLKALFDTLSSEQLEEQKGKVNELKTKGNDLYKDGKYLEATAVYTEALNSCPLPFSNERSILYGNRAASNISMEKDTEALTDCNKALELNPQYMKVLIRRAQLNRKTDHLDACLEDFKKILEMDPNNREARQACATLPAEINERNEKLKTEMLGKLKDLGNVILRPFGLSTDNFNVVQDPNSGGYSINFQK